MKDITVEPRRIVRAVVIAVALSALAACSVLDDGTPFLKIKGSIVTGTENTTIASLLFGSSSDAKKCKLRLTSLSGTWLTDFDAYGSGININWASRYFYDAERGAYPGVNIEISCARNRYASVTITDAQMVANNSNIDLGTITVQ